MPAVRATSVCCQPPASQHTLHRVAVCFQLPGFLSTSPYLPASLRSWASKHSLLLPCCYDQLWVLLVASCYNPRIVTLSLVLSWLRGLVHLQDPYLSNLMERDKSLETPRHSSSSTCKQPSSKKSSLLAEDKRKRQKEDRAQQQSGASQPLTPSPSWDVNNASQPADRSSKDDQLDRLSMV